MKNPVFASQPNSSPNPQLSLFSSFVAHRKKILTANEEICHMYMSNVFVRNVLLGNEKL